MVGRQDEKKKTNRGQAFKVLNNVTVRVYYSSGNSSDGRRDPTPRHRAERKSSCRKVVNYNEIKKNYSYIYKVPPPSAGKEGITGLIPRGEGDYRRDCTGVKGLPRASINLHRSPGSPALCRGLFGDNIKMFLPINFASFGETWTENGSTSNILCIYTLYRV